jgi:spore maturation protein CgeB
MPPNVRNLGHVGTREHNASTRAPRRSQHRPRFHGRHGFSPATRVFEAAGAGACLLTDAWVGLELFLAEARRSSSPATGGTWRILVETLDARAREGDRRGGRARILAEHTYGRRGAQVDAILRETGGTEARKAGGMRSAPERGPCAPRRLGLSLSSSWGNGHATTYRALLKAFAERGHDILFLERDVPWYRAHRDLAHPGLLPASPSTATFPSWKRTPLRSPRRTP